MSNRSKGADRIRNLLDELDQRQMGRDEDAQAELLSIGTAVLPALTQRTPSLSAGGQLCAIEIFRELRGPESELVLVRLISSENATVRRWAAEAVGHLGMTSAVSELQSSLVRSREAGKAPDDGEPASARHALTALGARIPVMPPEFRELTTRDDTLGIVVPDHLLTTALEKLGAGSQVIAFFQRWRPWRADWTRVDGSSFQLDWNQPWANLVEQSLQQATAAAASLTRVADAVVTIEWLGIEDALSS